MQCLEDKESETETESNIASDVDRLTQDLINIKASHMETEPDNEWECHGFPLHNTNDPMDLTAVQEDNSDQMKTCQDECSANVHVEKGKVQRMWSLILIIVLQLIVPAMLSTNSPNCILQGPIALAIKSTEINEQS